jgi:hypothetical protein
MAQLIQFAFESLEAAEVHSRDARAALGLLLTQQQQREYQGESPFDPTYGGFCSTPLQIPVYTARRRLVSRISCSSLEFYVILYLI